ncbi:putative zinc-type alcohol dehydrogenase-like protein YogA [Mycena sanguinolenta]|uniref:Putative zinc-type alcohol dehydrogenase-like protein YogA n=1 Tax=Mycena sanguinolenta TaxID=230812 RepID=A0A8H6YS17_9AGAR|nr:putative zinc-type alcohol dehydrogenase-like protein YogA [Mycena sanguinolenta]
MSSTLPRTTKALVLRKSPPGRTPLFHDAVVQEQAIPPLKPGEVLVKMGAVAFNHRDLWIRKGMYPRIAIGSTFGADGAGTVIAAADPADPLLKQRVFLTPSHGWESDPNGPESNYGILGGGSFPALGTFAEYVVVPRAEVLQTPAHLTDEQIAAWPLGGSPRGGVFGLPNLWLYIHLCIRAVSLAAISRGDAVLITGIGGGVALLALQICVAMGASVYVTSGSQQKIDRAVKLGAKGGVLYSTASWPDELGTLLKQNRTTLASIIDSGGKEIMTSTSKYLKHGGRVVCYGMTAGPTISMTMREVMRGQQLIGTMMGSRADLVAATAFLAQHKIIPVVSVVLPSLEAAEEGFKMMEKGSQFGKIVVKVGDGAVKAHL